MGAEHSELVMQALARIESKVDAACNAISSQGTLLTVHQARLDGHSVKIDNHEKTLIKYAAVIGMIAAVISVFGSAIVHALSKP